MKDQSAAAGEGRLALRTTMLTDAQREWVNLQRVLIRDTQTIVERYKRVAFGGKTKYPFVCRLVESTVFERGMMLSICMNALVMALEHYGQSARWTEALNIANAIFILGFAIEVALKLAAYGFRPYFTDGWHRFEAFVAAVAIVGAALNLTSVSSNVSSSSNDVGVVFRVIALTRILKLVRMVSGARRLMNTFVLSLPSLGNVAGLLGLLFAIYAVWGVKYFSTIKHGDNINENANFESFGNAMLLLFRMSTGEAWPGIMGDCMVQAPDCDPLLGECGYQHFAPLYFCSFIVLGTFCFLNLFIAVILDSFADVIEEEESTPVSPEDMIAFWTAWRKYDTERSLHLSVGMLVPFVRDLSRRSTPLVPHLHTTREVFNFVQKIPLMTNNDGGMHYREILYALAQLHWGDSLPEALETDLNTKWANLGPRVIGERNLTIAMHIAALRVQKIWRGHAARRQGQDHQDKSHAHHLRVLATTQLQRLLLPAHHLPAHANEHAQHNPLQLPHHKALAHTFEGPAASDNPLPSLSRRTSIIIEGEKSNPIRSSANFTTEQIVHECAVEPLYIPAPSRVRGSTAQQDGAALMGIGLPASHTESREGAASPCSHPGAPPPLSPMTHTPGVVGSVSVGADGALWPSGSLANLTLRPPNATTPPRVFDAMPQNITETHITTTPARPMNSPPNLANSASQSPLNTTAFTSENPSRRTSTTPNSEVGPTIIQQHITITNIININNYHITPEALSTLATKTEN